MRALIVRGLLLGTLLGAAPAVAEETSPALTPEIGSGRVIYVPLLLNAPAPLPTVVFGSGESGGELTGVGSAFPFGVAQIRYQVRLVGAAGLTYREEWSVSGRREPLLDTARPIAADPEVVGGALARTDGGPLPRGVYTVRIFLNGQLAGGGAAVIQ